MSNTNLRAMIESFVVGSAIGSSIVLIHHVSYNSGLNHAVGEINKYLTESGLTMRRVGKKERVRQENAKQLQITPKL